MKKQKIIDDAYKKLEMINQWINNSDSKSSIVLGLVGIIITIIFTNTSFVDDIIRIISRISKHMIFKANDDDIIDDLLNQIYQNSIICNKKYINFTNGLKYFLLGLLSSLVIYGLGILVYL